MIKQIYNLSVETENSILRIAAENNAKNMDFSNIQEFKQMVFDKELDLFVFQKRNIGTVGFIAGNIEILPDYFDIPKYLYKQKAINLGWLYVDKKYQRQGIGKSLLLAYSEYAKTKGAKYICLQQDEDSVSGKKFYKKMGFETIYWNKIGKNI